MEKLKRIGYGSAFNDLFIDGDTIIKRSINPYGHAKIENEIAFYKYLEKINCKFPIPQIKSYEIHAYSMNYMKEFVPLYTIYPTLEPEIQNKLLNSIYAALKLLHDNTQIVIDRTTYLDCINQEFYKKVLDRFEEIKDIISTYSHITKVNGLVIRPFVELVTSLYEFIKDSTTDNIVALIHGDCQFNNILYNPISASFVFIDPRGYWGTLNNGLGAPVYDFAKILFALSGYDVFDNMIIDKLNIEGDNLILDNIFLIENPPLKKGDITTMMTLSIWLANAHCFKQNPLKAIYSYFYACYLATLYAP